uniref:Uncharacterized protein n=1 Tax=Panagrolaimus sp. JU765 TaxID=591449 RepID=A0AC34Q461_9BILA
MVQLVSKPIWNVSELGSDIADDIRKLEDEFTTIKLASLKLFKNPTMWRKNQEINGTNWFIYPLMMQGTWMEENCNEDLELMEIIHSLSSTMPDCCFGNIFFSL